VAESSLEEDELIEEKGIEKKNKNNPRLRRGTDKSVGESTERIR